MKQSTLEAKQRKFFREGKISLNEITSHEITQDPTGSIRENTVGHYTLENLDRDASPEINFLENVENVVTRFLRDHSNNKVPTLLNCEMY